MHRGHDHDHHHHGHGGAPGTGHNHARPRPAIQWQTPHLPHQHSQHLDDSGERRDLDLVETAFAEGFAAAEDPTSFLRLANIPFEGETDGVRVVLLRVENETVTDVGSVMPHLGGGTFRYDPLPAKMVTRRRRLRFIYRDGNRTRALDFAEARALRPL